MSIYIYIYSVYIQCLNIKNKKLIKVFFIVRFHMYENPNTLLLKYLQKMYILAGMAGMWVNYFAALNMPL